MERRRTIGDANSFGQVADIYEKSRPTYPAEAAEWLVPAAAHTVLDLAAGTGKFTRSLLSRGLEVIAVEPDDKMRATLTAGLPQVRALAGTAESIPLPDASMDAVTVAQAWHWVDEARAFPEVARVLKPGGTLGLVWNLRDERVDWVRQLGAVMHHSEGERFLETQPVIGAPFGPTETLAIDWSMQTDLDALLGLVASRSYVITAEPKVREALLDGVRDLVATHPDLAGKQSFDMPYRTLCFRAAI